MVSCRDNSPAVQRVPPPELGRDTMSRDVEVPKPLPPQDMGPGKPFADEPLVVDQPPEAKAFVDIYNKVRRPRMLVFVNRTLDGSIVSTPARRSTGGVNADSRDYEPTAGYLKAGAYDEVRARTIDYGLIEMTMSDWLSCDGRVVMVSPTSVRRNLTDAQIKDIQAGRIDALTDLSKYADVLVQVQVRHQADHERPAGSSAGRGHEHARWPVPGPRQR